MTHLALALVLAAAPAAQDAPPPPPPPAQSAPPPPAPAGDERVVVTPPPRRPPDAVLDLAPARVRTLPADTLAALRADPAFAYDDPVVEGKSWGEVLREALARLWRRTFEAIGPGGIEAILYTLAIVAVGWALSRLLRADVGGLFGVRDRRAPSAGDPLLDVEDIAEIDLATRLAEARAAGDLRAALRLRYLLLLQALAAAGAVAWARDKTNRTYIAEVRAWDTARDVAIAAPFGRATRQFERVWYGGLDVTAERLAGLDADADAVTARLRVPA